MHRSQSALGRNLSPGASLCLVEPAIDEASRDPIRDLLEVYRIRWGCRRLRWRSLSVFVVAGPCPPLELNPPGVFPRMVMEHLLMRESLASLVFSLVSREEIKNVHIQVSIGLLMSARCIDLGNLLGLVPSINSMVSIMWVPPPSPRLLLTEGPYWGCFLGENGNDSTAAFPRCPGGVGRWPA